MSRASSVPYIPALREDRPSTATRRKVRRSRVRPIAVRGWRARMSPRSGKQLVAVGLAHVTRRPSVTSSGNPLTIEVIPRGTEVVSVDGIHPSRTPIDAARSLTKSVWENSTSPGPKPIQP